AGAQGRRRRAAARIWNPPTRPPGASGIGRKGGGGRGRLEHTAHPGSMSIGDRTGLDARLADVARQYDEVQADLAKPETSRDPDAIRRLRQELGRLGPLRAAVRT